MYLCVYTYVQMYINLQSHQQCIGIHKKNFFCQIMQLLGSRIPNQGLNLDNWSESLEF